MQSNDPCANSYIENNILVLFNKNINEEKVLYEYMKQTFDYIPPNDSGKVFVINGENYFIFSQQLNLMCMYSTKTLETTTESVLNDIMTILVKTIKKTLPDPKVANLVAPKLCMYLPDNNIVPFGFVRDDLYTNDVFGNSLGGLQLRMYIRTLTFNVEDYSLKLFPIPSKYIVSKIITQSPISTQSFTTLQQNNPTQSFTALSTTSAQSNIPFTQPFTPLTIQKPLTFGIQPQQYSFAQFGTKK